MTFEEEEITMLCIEVRALTVERDEWKAKHKECTRLLGEAMQESAEMAVERDAYEKCADTMAAAHKVERDEYVRCYNLLTQNAEKHLKELQIRQDCISFFTARARSLASENIALQTDHDALKAELEIARMVPYVAAMSEIAKERDALKDAARLALDALQKLWAVGDRAGAIANPAISALKAVL